MQLAITTLTPSKSNQTIIIVSIMGFFLSENFALVHILTDFYFPYLLTLHDVVSCHIHDSRA